MGILCVIFLPQQFPEVFCFSTDLTWSNIIANNHGKWLWSVVLCASLFVYVYLDLFTYLLNSVILLFCSKV